MTSPASRAEGEPGPAGGRRLLIVDDEEAISFAMWDYFGRSGYAVDRARTRDEAEALLAGEPYDLVIADLRLSVNDPRGGLDLLRRVRDRHPGSRVLLLTAYGSAEVEAELSRLSGAVLLSKPQSLARIAEEVAQLVQLSDDPSRNRRLQPPPS